MADLYTQASRKLAGDPDWSVDPETQMSSAPPIMAPEPQMSVAPPAAAPAVTVTVAQPAATKPAARPAPAPQAPKDDLDQYLKPEYQTGGKAAPATTPVPGIAAQPPAPVEPSAPPPEQGIEDLPYDPTASSRKLAAEIEVGKQREQELVGQRVGDIEAKGEAEAAIGEQDLKNAEETTQRFRALADKYGERADELTARQEAELAEQKKRIGNPPFDTVGLVFGIVSAVAAAQGKGQLAVAMQGLGQVANYRMQKWQAGVNASKAGVEGMDKLVDYNRAMTDDEAKLEANVSGALAAEIDAALDAVKRQATTEEQRDAAELTKLGLRQTNATAKLAQNKKDAKTAARRRIYAEMGRAGTVEEQQALAARYGELGQDVYRDFTKSNLETLNVDKKAADIMATTASAEKDRAIAAEKAAGPDTGGIPVTHVTNTELPMPVRKEIAKGAESMATVESLLGRLHALAVKNKGSAWEKIDANDAAEIENIQSMGTGLLSQATGSGAPQEAEREFYRKVFRDPQKMFSRADSDVVIASTLRNLQNAQDARLAVHGIYRKGTEKANVVAASRKLNSPAAYADSVIEMRSPDGEVIRVPASAREALLKTSARGMPWADVEPAGEEGAEAEQQ